MLPKIDLPIYEIKLPSSGKPVKIRPFVVREEKLLLIALESGDEREIIETTKQIVNNCLVDKVDIDKLPFFDVDYIFIALRAKAVGDTIDVKYTCYNEVDGTSCDNTFPAKIDVMNYTLLKDENIKDKIQLTGTLSVKMRYPSYTVMRLLDSDMSNFDKKINIIAECVDIVADKEKVYTRKDYTNDELIDFIENLPQQQYKRLEEFVDNFPSFIITSKATCPKCKYEHTLDYRDFTDFFV